MKLSRFELLDDPGQARSGIFHEGRLYETDGKSAIGVHDLGKIRLLPPIGLPPSIRVFDLEDGNQVSYHYANPSGLISTGGEFDAPPTSDALDLEVRVGAVVKDRGELIQPDEAAEFILGFTAIIAFVAQGTHGLVRDFPLVVGPFLTTPEEINSEPEAKVLGGIWRLSISVNGQPIHSTEFDDQGVFGPMLVTCSKRMAVVGGDLIAAPAIPTPSIPGLMRKPLMPGDSLLVAVENLGALNVRIV